MSKTHWKSLINPDYLGAYSLGDLEEMTVTIDFVQVEEVTGAQGKKEYCSVARLVDQKPMILNVTNSKSIAKLYGQFIEDWSGKQITLYATTTRLGQDTVECLRIRPKVAKKEKRPLGEKGLNRALDAIKAGTFTTVQLNEEYALTEAQQAHVTEVLSETAA